MSSLAFSGIDIINTTLTPSSQEGGELVSYRTKSNIGFRGRRTTTLAALNGKTEVVVGGIDWREKVFVVQGKTWELCHLKSKPAGLYKSFRTWEWGGNNYNVALSDKQWTATSTDHIMPVVTFNRCQSNIFKPNRPGSIHFTSGMSEQDKIFFILVMLYSEIQMQDEYADGHLRPTK